MADQQGGGFQLPAKPNATPGLPQSPQFLVFDGFEGLNTKPTRPAIGDQECFWLDNIMPLGKSNARSLPDIGAPLNVTLAPGVVIQFFAFGNISDAPICIVFLSNGGIKQINTATNVQSTIAPSGTILDSTQQIGVAQWGSQYILICAPQTNGYFIWDGTLFYQAGTIGPQVTITNSGSGYNSGNQPTIGTIGGLGSGAGFTAILSSSGAISTIMVTNNGGNYGPNDIVALTFSNVVSGRSQTTATAVSFLSNGALAAIQITNSGTGYNSSSVKVNIQGGGGALASAVVSGTGGGINPSGGGVQAIIITNSGAGYTTPPTVYFTDAENPVAQATVAIAPYGIQGTSLETFAGHVWVTNGAAPTTPPQKSLTVLSAPNSVTDFNIGDGAGAFISTDSFLRVGYHALRQSNGFLYFVGDSSVNYVAGVQTTGNPPITTFSNQNVDPQIGTPWGNSVQVYSRAVVFANTFGVHALYGGAIQKVSGPLDGIYSSITPIGNPPQVAGIIPSSAVAIIYGIHVYMLLMPIIDKITGLQHNALLMWDGKNWWTASQNIHPLYQIASQEINSVITAYGTDGAAIYPMFQTPSPTSTKTIQSKLWDKPTYIIQKTLQEYWAVVKTNVSGNFNLTVTIDNETGPVATQSTLVSSLGSSGIAVFNNRLNPSGYLMGVTFQTTFPDFTMISATLIPQQYKLAT